jgi:diguanylate cyclase
MTVSFEQARKALAFLEHHQLEPSAANYELALAYVTNGSPDLSREIDALTDGGVRVSRREADNLVKRFLSTSKAVLGKREKAVAQQTKALGVLRRNQRLGARCGVRSVSSERMAEVYERISLPSI